MSKNILVNFDFNGNEIQNPVVHNLGAAPAALEGKIYYNTTSKVIFWYDGTTWNAINTIDDAGTAVTDLWSADKIQSAINTAVSSGVTYKGALDASVPTPDLNVITSEVGDMYTTTVAGTITFTTGTLVLDIGDVVIAEAAGVLNNANQWTVVEHNLEGALLSANNLSDVASAVTAFSNIKQAATESATGVAEIATQAEVTAGTDDTRIVTPLKLEQRLTGIGVGFSVALNSALGTVARVFAGGQTTYTVTHSLNTLKTHVTVRLTSTEEEVVIENNSASVNTTDMNTTDIIFNGNSTDNTYNVLISS
jgi:hypothetical protein